MQKITPFLWYDKEAAEAAKFYASVFDDSKIKSVNKMRDTPSGTVEIVSMNILGYDFTLMAAGPLFKFTPSISFLVACDSVEKLNSLWAKLSQGGSALMPLDKYPFSERYGWLQDKYGLSWQLILVQGHEIQHRITPSLLFTGNQAGRAEEAIQLYTSVFKNSRVADIFRYGKDEKPDKEGTIKYAMFTLAGQQFAAMDSAREHNFNFNEATSFVVHCDNQDEVDYYWKKLSADPKAEQCGWIKDKFGVSWQVVPDVLLKFLQDRDQKKVDRVTQALLKMKKLDIAALESAYNG